MISDREGQGLDSWALLVLSVCLMVVGAVLTVVGGIAPVATARSARVGSPILSVHKSASWLQSVSLVCGAVGDHPKWEPTIGRAVRCVGPHVMWSPLPGTHGTVSAAGAAAVEVTCYAPSGHVVARATFRADGHGQWVGPAVWACPPGPVTRAVGA